MVSCLLATRNTTKTRRERMSSGEENDDPKPANAALPAIVSEREREDDESVVPESLMCTGKTFAMCPPIIEEVSDDTEGTQQQGTSHERNRMSLDVASNRTASKQSRTLSLPTDKFDIIKRESTHNQESHAQDRRMAKLARMTFLAKQWKKRTSKTNAYGDIGSIKSLLKQRPYTEVPHALQMELLNEIYPILQYTHKMYSTQLGPRNSLTVRTEKHLESVAAKLEIPTEQHDDM